MNNLIKRNPNIFGSILLLGIICAGYLVFFVLGNLIHVYVPPDPRALLSPMFYKFVVNPMGGMFITGMTMLGCALVCLVGFLLKELLVGVRGAVRNLGQWLVGKTAAKIQES